MNHPASTVAHPGALHAQAYRLMSSPVGILLITVSDQAIEQVLFDDMPDAQQWLNHHQGYGQNPDHPLLQQASQQLTEYFAGQRQTFSLPLAAKGTQFQQKVWAALSTIPYAVTWSYAQLAEAIQQPTAARAVGMANGKNPLSIVVPCHRVIGKNQKLVGYTGGLARKAWLLALEERAH